MGWRKFSLIGAVIVAGLALIGGLVYLRSARNRAQLQSVAAWNSGTIRATYVGAQLRETDSSNAVLILHYNLENNTDSDYQLSDSSGVVIMSKLKSDGTLTSEDHVRLGYSTFLPARQRARVALELAHPFEWPAEKDPAIRRKLQEFIVQRLADVDEFVLFDQASRRQIEFPKGWEELQLVSANMK